MYPIIMAGGSGTRLWPISRKNNPKQIKPFIDGYTLLQKTYKRLLGGFNKEKIYITTNITLKGLILEQIPSFPQDNFSIEPCKKGTAAALGLALIKIYRRDKNGIFIFINSDSYIKEEDEFLKILSRSEEKAKNNNQVFLIGIRPEYPETGYGYIERGELIDDGWHKVLRFVEKPNLEMAAEYVKSGNYLWNPTLIVSKIEYFLNLYKRHLPETYKLLMSIEPFMDTAAEEKKIKENFSLMTDTTIDYGILEKEKEMVVLPANIGWSDVGHWSAVKDILSGGGKEINIVKGKYINIDSYNNFIHAPSKKIISTIGLKDMIVVDTDDALLICPQNRAQDVKKIVSKIKEAGLEEYL